MRTVQEIDADIKQAKEARESMCRLEPDINSDSEGRAIFIENCNNRLTALAEEKRKAVAANLG